MQGGGGGLAGNRYIHTRNRVTLPVTPTRRTHVQARLGGYTRAERPAHTVSLVYISEVPWPPPSVTTSYIPLCPPTPPPRPPSPPPPLPPPSPAPPPPPAFCPSVSNLHSPPLALLTPPRPSIRRLLRVLIPQRRHPPNNPRCPSCEVSRTRVSLVRVSRVRRGGSWGPGRLGETKRETTLNFGPRSKTATGYEMRVRGRERKREEEETTRTTIGPGAAAVRLGLPVPS